MTVLRFILIVMTIKAVFLGGTSLGVAARVDEEEIRFIEGLRERRLFTLAADHCRQLLGWEDLEEGARVPLTLEWIRTCFAKALHSPPEERFAAWEQARRIAADFEQDDPDRPQGLLVRVQDALTVLAWAEMHRRESEVLADPEPALETARTALREARRLLNQRQDELSERIRLRHRQPGESGELTADQLISLQHRLHFHLARTYRNRALCYPPDSEDRVAALISSVEQLNQPLQQIAESDRLIWPFQLDLALSYRLLGQVEEATPILKRIMESDAPAPVRLRARAEAARIELDGRRPEQAMRVLQAGRQLNGHTEPELDQTYLKTFLALADEAAGRGDPADAGRWRERALQLVELMHQTHGPYWGRRSDLLLLRSLGPSATGSDFEVLSRTADELYRQGQLVEAVQAYDRAAAGARAAEADERAFTLAYRAALVLQTDRQHGEARERLQALAMAKPEHPQSAAAHLLAAWNAAQAARNDPAVLDTYGELLAEHVRKWPQDETVDTARGWQGQLLESQEEWRAAAGAYLQVSPQAERYETSLQAAIRCWNRALDQAAEIGEPTELLRAEAVESLRQHFPPTSDSDPDEWTPAARAAAYQIAIWKLASGNGGYAEAQQLLERAITGGPPPDPEWKERAQVLRIAALAGLPDQLVAAEQLWDQIDEPSPASLLLLLRRLHRMAEATEADRDNRRAELILAVSERLEAHRDRLDDAQRTVLRRIRAAALLAVGAQVEARTAYEQLARDYPDDGDVQRAYAQLLLEAEDAESWQQALERWRTIAARSRPRSEGWYAARWGVASALIQLGREDEAARRIRYWQAIPPGLADSGWQARFQDLLERCGEATD